ncbi:MAG: phosphoglycerate dehydrogenase [archaeon]|nr:phosphoglycerate dehydrogenase [archaeon]
MKALIADAINEKGIENLKEVADVVVDTSITPEELLETIGEYDGIIVRSRTKLPAEVIAKADNLKIIGRAGVGVDNIDVNAATEKGIMVVNAPESTSITVAEHTMGLILSAVRKIAVADKSTKEDKWEKKRFMGMELKDKTLGVIGMGRIGSQVVNRCKAFQMDAIAYDPYLPAEVAKQMGVELLDSKEELLKRADIITIHVPLTPETKHSISTKEFEMMKDTAFIFNCARGGIIDEDALYDALKEGKIGGAGLDVYENEGKETNNKLYELDNIVCTPHIAASTKEAQRDAAIIVADELIELFKGNMPRNIINMPRINNSGFEDANDYLEVCDKLGSFISQSTKGAIKELEITYSGEIADVASQELFTRTVLQGLLNPISEAGVNAVNARNIAKGRGIDITEAKNNKDKGYGSLVKLTAKTDVGDFSVVGTYLHEPTIIEINGYRVDVKPEGDMFIAKYKDIPGSIGAIGTKLGEYNVNVGIMQVGRDIQGGKAIMVLTLDNEAPKEAIDEIKALSNVEDATTLKFN